ncbi:TetR/AcrR family transcriptional regulator [Brevibacillus laterosporus]|uniref:TetR/AcrR family transcriptional regulator n=1 Tax=Brevibacillus laterosporus TaxID=1465 RepID=A0A502IEG5_BRELA|nr:TetR/AcrR family transcriptional regulator [Brevibacillus laterosporus]QDX91825.1 TetR/AcrR family transcriptional regulator [Brevibacillus laterosporus]TPG70196.1 TetR/AcrR family transcriptional regulator [Brevibacillus laterosporus]TPG83590.1 TetR/AcrR family transcriptional regulator [Brevibacillus laterosporus]
MNTENKHKLKSQESYKKIIEASFKVFAQHGFDKTSIDLIAKEAGYTKGTFYLHFTSKEEFFLRLMETRLEKYKQQYEPLLNSNDSMENLIKQGIDIFYKVSSEDNWIPIFFEFCANAIRNEKLKEGMSTYYKGWVNLIASVLQKGVMTNQLPKDLNVNEMAAVIIGLLDGRNLQRNFVHNNIDQNKMEQIIKRVIGLPA